MKNKFLTTFFSLMLLNGLLISLESEISTIGTIQASSISSIGSQVTGRVDKILIDIGSAVKKGQPLVILDLKPFEIDLALASASLEAAKIELADAELNYLRMQKLWQKPEGETPSIPLKRYEDAKTKYDQSIVLVKQAEQNLRKAKLDLDEAIIKAPFDGVISKKMVDTGESISKVPITEIAEIQALNILYLEFSIPQVYQDLVAIGSPITFSIDGLELKNNQASIALFYPALDDQTRSLRCRAILDNKELKIRPGCIARVIIKTSRPDFKPEGNKL